MYPESGKYPKGATKDMKRKLREKAESFFVSDKSLFHKVWNGRQQRVVCKEEVESL